MTLEPYMLKLSKYGILFTNDITRSIEVGEDIAGKLYTLNCKQLNSGITSMETKLG